MIKIQCSECMIAAWTCPKKMWGVASFCQHSINHILYQNFNWHSLGSYVGQSQLHTTISCNFKLQYPVNALCTILPICLQDMNCGFQYVFNMNTWMSNRDLGFWKCAWHYVQGSSHVELLDGSDYGTRFICMGQLKLLNVRQLNWSWLKLDEVTKLR